MGEIVIKIPSNKKRRYVLADAKRAEELISVLDISAVRVKENPAKLTRQQLQDFRDGQAADRSLAEMRRTGISYSLDEIKKELGL